MPGGNDQMENVLAVIISVVGSYLITRATNNANQARTNAEIDAIYERLGIDKEISKAESANTWMDVARKATKEYERVMNENVSLKKQLVRVQRQVRMLKSRIASLEARKKNRNV